MDFGVGSANFRRATRHCENLIEIHRPWRPETGRKRQGDDHQPRRGRPHGCCLASSGSGHGPRLPGSLQPTTEQPSDWDVQPARWSHTRRDRGVRDPEPREHQGATCLCGLRSAPAVVLDAAWAQREHDDPPDRQDDQRVAGGSPRHRAWPRHAVSGPGCPSRQRRPEEPSQRSVTAPGRCRTLPRLRRAPRMHHRRSASGPPASPSATRVEMITTGR
jgi:hypothetical protein